MSITSFSFLLFLAVLLAVYYLTPKKWQWVVLLCASAAFYLLSGVEGFVFVLLTAATSYGAVRWMQALADRQKAYFAANRGELSREEKSAFKAATKKKRRTILIVTLVLNFGVLCFFKYFHFLFAQVNGLLGLLGLPQGEDTLRFLVPLGISFYTFQTMGYVVDVYWGNCRAEGNFLKTLLFVSFFPQITQGPISDFEQLSAELFTGHSFCYENYSLGGQRMLWGFFKKIVIADLLAPYVGDIFQNYAAYSGATVMVGGLMYSVQIYADFSGYMDIMCGLCQMLGIRLRENFDRPYFSKSIAEYWRRWHISLGDWFKKYIYYPIAMAKWNLRIGQKARTHFGKTLPASIALVAVWLTTGLWHGASWAYIAWGGVNGLFIILSLWLEPVYQRCKHALHIREASFWWRAFQTVRTFLLVTFIKVLPEVGTLRDGLGFWKRAFTAFTLPSSLQELLPMQNNPTSVLSGFCSDLTGNLLIIAFGVCLMFVASLLQRKTPCRQAMQKWPRLLRWAFFVALAVLTVWVKAYSGLSGGFMYAQF